MARRGKGKRSGRSRRERRPSFASRRLARSLEGVKEIDPRDYELLRKFLTDHGKILPGRLVGATAKQQRQIKRAIRRARTVGILP
ncbi:MAG: 30S ribosomal protein S18 [Lentisphaerae bacterium]|nr:30S ribosomal protein S18 [Lentisphaerota bacterium]